MSITIKYLGHSAFLIKYGESSIIIDPFIKGNPEAKVNPNDLDVQDVFLTHAHGDHLGDAIEISEKTGAKISAIYELANYCIKNGAEAQGLNMGGAVEFSWGKAWWLPAAHSSSTPDGEYGGEPASILLEIDGKRIYNAGDTGLHYDLKMVGEFYRPDIALLPVGGYYTMGIDEAVKATEWLGCKKVIPMHYNTFPAISINVEEFKTKIESKTDAECIILKPGESFLV